MLAIDANRPELNMNLKRRDICTRVAYEIAMPEPKRRVSIWKMKWQAATAEKSATQETNRTYPTTGFIIMQIHKSCSGFIILLCINEFPGKCYAIVHILAKNKFRSCIKFVFSANWYSYFFFMYSAFYFFLVVVYSIIHLLGARKTPCWWVGENNKIKSTIETNIVPRVQKIEMLFVSYLGATSPLPFALFPSDAVVARTFRQIAPRTCTCYRPSQCSCIYCMYVCGFTAFWMNSQ